VAVVSVTSTTRCDHELDSLYREREGGREWKEGGREEVGR